MSAVGSLEPYGVRLTLSGVKKEPERRYQFAGNAGVWTLPIDASFTSDKDSFDSPPARDRSPSRSCIRERQQRHRRYRVPCNSVARMLISRARGALLLWCTQASV